MNIIAIDIGNSNITVGLFVEDQEKFIEAVSCKTDDAAVKLKALLTSAWQQVPFVQSDKVKKRDGFFVVSSVNPDWTEKLTDICKKEFDEKIRLIGKDVDLPIEMGVDNKYEVGTDRVVSAAAAFAVVEDTVVVADFGTAVTIDLVDEEGTFLGGVIAPGFELGAESLKLKTAKLKEVGINVEKPKNPVGGNTLEAVNNGLYYSAVGLLRTVTETYAEEIGRWPQVIVTGGAADVIKDDCDFVDSWVPNLTVRGIVLAFKKDLEEKAAVVEMSDKRKK